MHIQFLFIKYNLSGCMPYITNGEESGFFFFPKKQSIKSNNEATYCHISLRAGSFTSLWVYSSYFLSLNFSSSCPSSEKFFLLTDFSQTSPLLWSLLWLPTQNSLFPPLVSHNILYILLLKHFSNYAISFRFHVSFSSVKHKVLEKRDYVLLVIVYPRSGS